MIDSSAATVPGFTVPSYIRRFCREIEFGPGEFVHRAGHRYQDVYVVLDGFLDCSAEEDFEMHSLGPGSVVGDLGYILGFQAGANVIARTKVRALIIGYDTFSKIANEDRSLAVDFLRFLAGVMPEREISRHDVQTVSGEKGAINVLLCRDDYMLLEAMKLRYSICCEEQGRDIPTADHKRKIISSRLDESGYTFIAMERGEVIGMLHSNLARETPLPMIEDLYGMTQSVNHPANTAVCMTLCIKKSKRGTPAFLHLGRACLEHAMSRGIVEYFMHSGPALTPYFKLLGFRPSAERFYYDNSLCQPMVLDLRQNWSRLSGLAGLSIGNAATS